MNKIKTTYYVRPNAVYYIRTCGACKEELNIKRDWQKKCGYCNQWFGNWRKVFGLELL